VDVFRVPLGRLPLSKLATTDSVGEAVMVGWSRGGDLALFLSQPGDLHTQAIMFRLPDGGDFQQEVPRHSGDYTADGPHSGIY
jgi:hypothetical protein